MANIVLKNIYKVYDGGVRAVSDFNLDIGDKEFVVFVGPSGCGKSTTLRMIAGLEEITAGSLFMDGVLVNDVEPKDRNIAMVFQNYALYPHMTVYQNMSFGLRIHKMPAEEIDRRVKMAAEILGIENLLTRKPKALSGGQRQRVALGRAIVREPAVFLLDEPLSNLDAKLRVQMRAEITKLHQKLATTFIYVTHDQTEAMTMGSRIVVMKDGFIQQADTPTVLYEEPINAFVATFLGSPQMNMIDAVLSAHDDTMAVEVGGTTVVFPQIKRKQLIGGESVFGDVIFGIRPENITISETDGVPAKIDLVEHLGRETIVYCKIANREDNIIASVPSNHGLKRGMDIFLQFDMLKSHLFDRTTKQTIMGVPAFNCFNCTLQGNTVDLGSTKLALPEEFMARTFDFTAERTCKISLQTSKLRTEPVENSVSIQGTVDFTSKGSDSYAVYLTVKGQTTPLVFRTTDGSYTPGQKVTLYVPQDGLMLWDNEGNKLVSVHVVSKNTAPCTVKVDGDTMQVKVGPTTLTLPAREGIADGEHTITLVSDKLNVIYDKKFAKQNGIQKQEVSKNVVTALAYDEDELGAQNAVFVQVKGWDDYVTAVVPNNFSVYKMPKFALEITPESVIIK